MQYTHIYTCRHTNAKSFVPTISLAAVGPAVMPVIAVVVFTRGRLIRSDPIKHTRASGRFVPFVPLTTKPPRFYPRCVVETEDARVKRGYNRVLERAFEPPLPPPPPPALCSRKRYAHHPVWNGPFLSDTFDSHVFSRDISRWNTARRYTGRLQGKPNERFLLRGLVWGDVFPRWRRISVV